MTRRWFALPVLCAALLVAGCTIPPDPTTQPPPSSPAPTTVPPTTPPPTTTPPPPPPVTPEVAGALRPLPAPTGCTATAGDAKAALAAIAAAKPGARVCVTGNLGSTELKVTNSGTPEAPIAILGDGKTVVGKLTITADWVFASGLNVVRPKNAPGISIKGAHITVMDSTVDRPSGGDGDAIRFWGSDLRILHNTLSNTSNTEGHADCAQHFSTSTSYPETHDVYFEWNRCESIANIALIAEGPDSSYGDGSGKGNTYRIFIRHNYLQAKSAQAIWLDDVQDWVIEDNVFDGGVDHALGATNKSTGGVFRGNVVKDIECEVGMSKDSRDGYQGPVSKCAP